MLTKRQIRLAKKNGTIDRIYADAVNALIRRKYTLSDELAILRKRDENPEEFSTYNSYAEQCKSELITLIDSVN